MGEIPGIPVLGKRFNYLNHLLIASLSPLQIQLILRLGGQHGLANFRKSFSRNSLSFMAFVPLDQILWISSLWNCRGAVSVPVLAVWFANSKVTLEIGKKIASNPREQLDLVFPNF